VVELDWYRVLLAVNVPLGRAWDFEAELPYDVKDVEVRYELPGGGTFDNPQGDLHHRTETLEGVADVRLLLNWRTSPVPGHFLRLGAGVTLPTGRIEENPYETPVVKHQHIQFGSGTVDPLLRADYGVAFGEVSFTASAGLHAPLYENREDYRAPAEFDASIGPVWKAADALALTLRWSALYQSGGAWDGETDPNTGYFQHGLGLSASIRLSKDVALIPSVLRTLSIDTRGGDDTYEMDWLVGLTLEARFGAPRARPASAASPP
jgi:hypothetical protein